MVRRAVVKYSDWDARVMVAISQAESGCGRSPLGDTTLEYTLNGHIYGYSVGAFQVRILPGREHCDTYDVTTNVECAHAVWSGQGYNAWTQYQNGEYQKFL